MFQKVVHCLNRIILLSGVYSSIVICFSGFGYAAAPQNKQIIDLRPAMTSILTKQLAGQLKECRNQLTVSCDHYFSTNTKDVILLLKISDYLCHQSNSFIPVRISPHGTFEIGTMYSGSPGLLLQQSETSYWMSTQWMIEGTYPELYKSSDGLFWKKVLLPENRNIDCCFEWITDICFSNNSIRVSFRGDTEQTIGSWETIRPSNKKTGLIWNKVPPEKPEAGDIECSKKAVNHVNWQAILVRKMIKLEFDEPSKSSIIILPAMIP